jgi:hypothetical protein
MGSLLGKIAEEHRDFEEWCENRQYPFPSREFWKHQPYYDEYKLPEKLKDEENQKSRKSYNEKRRNDEGDKIGLLNDRFLGTPEVDYTCGCGHPKARYLPGFVLTSEYGCAKCGNVVGGEY